MASIGENGERKLILLAPERKKGEKIVKYRLNSYQINEMMGFINILYFITLITHINNTTL
jgi:hypothetical protein